MGLENGFWVLGFGFVSTARECHHSRSCATWCFQILIEKFSFLSQVIYSSSTQTSAPVQKMHVCVRACVCVCVCVIRICTSCSLPSREPHAPAAAGRPMCAVVACKLRNGPLNGELNVWHLTHHRGTRCTLSSFAAGSCLQPRVLVHSSVLGSSARPAATSTRHLPGTRCFTE